MLKKILKTISWKPEILRVKLCILALAFLFVGEAAADTFNMKIGIVTRNDPIFVYAKEFKRRIEEKTNGRIKAEVFAGGQLGKVQQLIQGAQFGSVEMFIAPPGFLKGIEPAFQSADVVGLFDNIEHGHASLTDPAFRDPFLQIGINKGLVGVSIFAYGGTSFATQEPFKTLADLKGQKIRVLATKVEAGLMDKLGATGIPMPFGDIVPALQRGIIDGVRSSIVATGAIKVHTVVKNITVTDEATIPVVSMVSRKFYEKLPSDLQAAVLEVGKEMEPYMLKVVQKSEANGEQMWIDGGATIYRLSEAERRNLLDIGRGVTETVLGGNPSTQLHYRRLKDAADNNRQ